MSAKVGLCVNPMSGRDVRRLAARASKMTHEAKRDIVQAVREEGEKIRAEVQGDGEKTRSAVQREAENTRAKLDAIENKKRKRRAEFDEEFAALGNAAALGSANTTLIVNNQKKAKTEAEDHAFAQNQQLAGIASSVEALVATAP